MALALPIFQSKGGYFYDFSELFFFAAAIWLVMQNRLVAILPLTVLATVNKKSFFFFLLALYPFVRERVTREKAVALTLIWLLAAGTTYLAIRMAYVRNPGDTAVLQASLNLNFYLNPTNLFGGEITYGVLMPKPYHFVVLGLIAMLVIRSWGRLSAAVRHHIVLAGVVNALLLLFCAPGEMRNLSMLYIGFLLILAQCLSQTLRANSPAAQ